MSGQRLIEYVFRDMPGGEFWIDIRVDRMPYNSVGPFETDGARLRAYDDLLSMMRSLGATDLPPVQ